LDKSDDESDTGSREAGRSLACEAEVELTIFVERTDFAAHGGVVALSVGG
jgi:hypothetical protein